MIFQTPPMTEVEDEVMQMIAEQKERLRYHVASYPRRWFGSLRRSTFARAIQGSNSIEGYHASVDEAIKIIDDDPPMDERTETWYALKGYRDALTYIMQTSHDPYFEFSKQFLKSLHFMMVGHEMKKNPGQWRPGPIFVVNQSNNDVVYEAPQAEKVNDLIDELVAHLKQNAAEANIIAAAMAHLNLTMIHPFSDGNGRMARALQTLILARDGTVNPIFSSIEEWLGRNTQEYYGMLALIGQGQWRPEADAMPWVRFCLKAHYQQSATLIRRNEEYDVLYNKIQSIIQSEKLQERSILPLFDVALGMRLTNSRYRAESDVTEFVASRDLKKLCEVGMLEPKGEKRARTYTSSKKLQEIRDSVRIARPIIDPFKSIENRKLLASALAQGLLSEPRLPGM